jgi:hypothetical protein
MTTKHEADALWTACRAGFQDLQEVIREIIATKAWEPLGYPTFAAAWNDRMKGVPLATDATRALVIYALYDDLGPDARDVALDLPGVGPSVLDQVEAARALGVDAEDALHVVRRHWRKPARAPFIIHVEMSADEYEALREIAKARDTTPAAIGGALLADYLAGQAATT